MDGLRWRNEQEDRQTDGQYEKLHGPHNHTPSARTRLTASFVPAVPSPQEDKVWTPNSWQKNGKESDRKEAEMQGQV